MTTGFGGFTLRCDLDSVGKIVMRKRLCQRHAAQGLSLLQLRRGRDSLRMWSREMAPSTHDRLV